MHNVFQFMKEHFYDATEKILFFKAHRDPLVRKTVVTLIPALASYDTQSFCEHFLHKAMAHLLLQLEKPTERHYGSLLHSANVSSLPLKPNVFP